MNGYRLFLSLVLPAALALPASAGIFFNQHPKPNPATRVPELLQAVRTETDEHKRTAAAQELRNYDANAFPEIVPALVDLTLRDPNTAVRLEAVQSLTKLRPVSQQAGWALEQAMEKDSSRRVRLLARTSLLQYHVSGYRSGKAPEAPGDGSKTSEPPLAGSGAKAQAAAPRVAGPRPLPVGPPLLTSEPPLLETVPTGSAKAQDGPELTPPK